jgi:hypothetical protein
MEILIWIGFIITILILFYITYVNYKIMNK